MVIKGLRIGGSSEGSGATSEEALEGSEARIGSNRRVVGRIGSYIRRGVGRIGSNIGGSGGSGVIP